MEEPSAMKPEQAIKPVPQLGAQPLVLENGLIGPPVTVLLLNLPVLIQSLNKQLTEETCALPAMDPLIPKIVILLHALTMVQLAPLQLTVMTTNLVPLINAW
jgi:hypothetical protein